MKSVNNNSKTLVGIVCALGREAKGIAGYLEGKSWETLDGGKLLYGHINGRKVAILKSGIGKTRAAIGTRLLIDHCRPAYVINFGTAGAVDDRLKIKDVVLSTMAVMYDIDHHDAAKTVFHAAPELLRLGSDLPGVYLGPTCSADKLVCSELARKRLTCEYSALCADWEGAAILEVCHINKIPGLVLRVISDRAGRFASMEFLFHHKVAIARGADTLAQLISRIPL